MAGARKRGLLAFYEEDIMKLPFKQIFASAKEFVRANTPSIMIGAGIISMGAAVISAARATPLALDRLDEKADELDVMPCDLTKTERFQAVWRCYVPAIILALTGTASIVGGHVIQIRRTIAIASAAALTEQAFAEYKAIAAEQLGEAGVTAVREKLADKKIEKANHAESNSIEELPTSSAAVRCLEPYSGRFFWSDANAIERAVNAANRILLDEGSLSLNEFYDELGLDHIPPGEAIGWNYYRDQLIKIHFTARLAEGSRPVLVFDYDTRPSTNFMH